MDHGLDSANEDHFSPSLEEAAMKVGEKAARLLAPCLRSDRSLEDERAIVNPVAGGPPKVSEEQNGSRTAPDREARTGRRGMGKTKTAAKRRPVVPESAADEAARQMSELDDSRVMGTLKGRFIYVEVDGEPLCRFEYDGSETEWRFALYRYSRGGYSTDVCPYPSRNRIDEGVKVALRIYNLL
jgi:hypothetical protein